MISGKIIPAIATTTAMIVSQVLIEIFKTIQGKSKEDHRNCSINLALPSNSFISEPASSAKITTGFDKELGLNLIAVNESGRGPFTVSSKFVVDIGSLTGEQLC